MSLAQCSHQLSYSYSVFIDQRFLFFFIAIIYWTFTLEKWCQGRQKYKFDQITEMTYRFFFMQHIGSYVIPSAFIWGTVRIFLPNISCFCQRHRCDGLLYQDMKSDRMLNTSHELPCLSLIFISPLHSHPFCCEGYGVGSSPVKLYESKQQSFLRPFKHKEQNASRIRTVLSITQAPSQCCFVTLIPIPLVH